MSLKLRLAFARSQNIISNFHRLAVRSSPCYVHSSLFSTRISKSPSSDDDEDNDDYADDIDTSPLDNLLRMKPAILRRSKEDDFEGRPDKNEDLNLDDEDKRDPRYILGKKLLSLGKVHYRHIENLPEWLTAGTSEVCSNRTTAQVRRSLQNWMIKIDRDVLEGYRTKKLGWKKDAKLAKLRPIIVYGPEETVAYTHFFLPSRYSIMKRIVQEMQILLPSFQPKRVMDFGCGPASAGAAVSAVYHENMEKYIGVDMSRSMIDAAKVIMESVRTHFGTDSVFYEKSGEVLKRADQKGDRYDVVIASYTLSELPSDAARRAATQLLFELLDDGGVLIILEAGNPQGSHTVRTARELILDNFNNKDKQEDEISEKDSGKKTVKVKSVSGFKSQAEKNGIKTMDIGDNQTITFADKSVRSSKTAETKTVSDKMMMVLSAPKGLTHETVSAHVVSPCTHDKACPLELGTWCSFSQRVHSSLIRQDGEEKFSYVIIQKRGPTDFEKAKADREAAVSRMKTSALFKGKVKSPNGSDSRIIDLWTSDPVGDEAALKRTKKADGTETVDSSTRPNNNPTPLEVLSRFTIAKDEELPKLVWNLIDEVDWEEYSPPLYRQEYGRVIRSPLKATGHVTMDLCLSNGNIGRNVLSKGNVMHVPSLYTALRKTTWGGLVPLLQDDMMRSAFTDGRKGVMPRIPKVTRDERIDMNIKKYEAPLHGRAKKKFDLNDSDDDEEEDKNDRKRSVSTASGRRVRSAEMDVDDEDAIDGKDFLKMLQKKKTVRSTSSRSKDGSVGSADSENVPVEKKAGRRFLREKPTRKKGSVEYFSAELNDDEKESMQRAQMKDTLSEEMLAKKALKDAKFKRLLSKKSADDDKRYRD